MKDLAMVRDMQTSLGKKEPTVRRKYFSTGLRRRLKRNMVVVKWGKVAPQISGTVGKVLNTYSAARFV